MPKQTAAPVSRAENTAPQDAPRRTGFAGLRDEMERLFDSFEPLGWFDRNPLAGGGALSSGALSPALDLTENDTGYSLTVELPGLDPEAVDVKLSNGMLSISGEKTETEEHENDDRHVSERRWGSFRRAIRLPENVDPEKIDARFENGVLTVSLPKSETAKASEKKIEIKAG